jgi:diguanylate cyclase (GGDEF)-like protein
VLALMLLLMLLVVAVALSRAFREAEEQSIERYLDSVATHIETDLLDGAARQSAIQGRMATRLAFGGSFDEAAWRADAARLVDDHPFYRLLAVTDDDFTILWLIGDSVSAEPGGRFPLGAGAVVRLREGPPEMTTVILEPFSGPENRPALLFMTPVTVDGSPTNWLAAVMDLPMSIDAMLTGFYLQDVNLSVESGGSSFPLSAVSGSAGSGYDRRIAFDLGDGRSQVNVDVALRPEKAAELRSGLPDLIFYLGSALAVMLVAAALLAMAAARQARVLSRANQDLTNQVRDRELAERELEFLLTHDSLTDLPNRKGMLRQLERSASELGPNQSLAVFFIDLDQFKDINETLGHHLGDELLRKVPSRLARELADPDLLGRLGGDEFLVVLERSDRERIERVADNLIRAMERPFRIGEHQLFVTASIGVAYLDTDTASPGELVQNADAALFRAKQLGRNRHATFSPEMFARVEYRLNLSRDIRQALDQGEFQMVYQPVVCLKSLELRGVEALLRWPHRDGYNVPPRDFIRVAEETGVIQRMSRYALSRSVEALADWRARFEKAPWLAVNISGAQFREPEFVRDMSVLLHQHRIDPERLHLEITEEVLIENLARNRSILEQLDDIGIPIVVDDFGIGYSSLAYIKNFPVSTIKIDQNFVRGLEDDPDDQAITRTICDLSRELSLKTVAEGIEQPGQLDLLRQYGCEFGQGFLFMPPVSRDEISAILADGVPWRHVDPDSGEQAAPGGGGLRPAPG